MGSSSYTNDISNRYGHYKVDKNHDNLSYEDMLVSNGDFLDEHVNTFTPKSARGRQKLDALKLNMAQTENKRLNYENKRDAKDMIDNISLDESTSFEDIQGFHSSVKELDIDYKFSDVLKTLVGKLELDYNENQSEYVKLTKNEYIKKKALILITRN